MRYTVHLSPNHVESCETASEAAEIVVHDPVGGRYMVYDNQKQRYLTGAEIVLAYVAGRKRQAPLGFAANG